MPSNTGKPPSGDANALPSRTPQAQTQGAADLTAVQQALTRQSQTIDSILLFLNGIMSQSAASRTIGGGASGSSSVTTTAGQPQNATFKGSISAADGVTGDTARFDNAKGIDGTVVAYQPSPTGAAYVAVPTGGGFGLRVTNKDNTSNVATVDAAGNVVSTGPYDFTGNSVVRGNLHVTGAVQTGDGSPEFGAAADGSDMGPANPDGPVALGSLTVDGPMALGDADVNGNLSVSGAAMFGAGSADTSGALAYASITDGTINGVNINASALLTAANISSAGNVTAATANLATATIPNLSSTAATVGTLTCSNIQAGNATVNNGAITATDVQSTTAEISGATTVGSLASAGAVSGTNLTASGALNGATLAISNSGTVANGLTVGTLTSNGAISGTGITASGALSGATLAISGNSTLSGTLSAGSSTLASLGVTNNTTTKTLSVTGASTLSGAVTAAAGLTVTGGETVNGVLNANSGVVTVDVLTTTLETTGAVSLGTTLSVGSTANFIGSVTTPTIIAAAGYLTALPMATYYDTALAATANKIMAGPVLWNMSGSNGILGSGLGSTAYAGTSDWVYVPAVAGSLNALTGYIYSAAAATVTLALFINGTSAFTGTVATTAATRKYFALTSSRGALAFASGSYLQLYVKSSVAQTNFYTFVTPHVYL